MEKVMDHLGRFTEQYFPGEDPQRFKWVWNVWGYDNTLFDLMKNLSKEEREETMEMLIQEADWVTTELHNQFEMHRKVRESFEIMLGFWGTEKDEEKRREFRDKFEAKLQKEKEDLVARIRDTLSEEADPSNPLIYKVGPPVAVGTNRTIQMCRILSDPRKLRFLRRRMGENYPRGLKRCRLVPIEHPEGKQISVPGPDGELKTVTVRRSYEVIGDLPGELAPPPQDAAHSAGSELRVRDV